MTRLEWLLLAGTLLVAAAYIVLVAWALAEADVLDVLRRLG